jgi:Family of unknown function (DUF6492)
MIVDRHALHNKYSFVTVVYEAEYSLLLVQARSMQLYCPIEIVEDIVVIDNSKTGISPSWKNRLLASYGQLATFVRFVNAQEIARVPQGVGGYWSQQLLKLMVSLIIHTERYIILDAKNHLVFPLARSFFEAPDGRARINFHSYEDHVLRYGLERVLTYLELEYTSYIDSFAMCATPFIMYTNISKELIKYFSERERRAFECIFIKRELFEFFLYIGYIIHRKVKLDELYLDGQGYCPTVCSPHRTEECLREITLATEMQKPFFSLHSRAIARLSTKSRRAIANLWWNRRLFDSVNSANRFLVIYQITLISAALRRRLISRWCTTPRTS